MKKSLIRKVAALGAAALAVGTASVLASAPAQAAVVGNAYFTPAVGTAAMPQSLSTDGPCSAPATAVRAKAWGFGFPAAGQVISTQNTLSFSTTDPMTLSVSNAWMIYGENLNTYLDGDYDVRVECVNSFGNTVYDEYQTTITFSTPGNSVANLVNATYTTPLVNTATSTTLAVNPAGPIDEGDTVDLTATVAPAAATGEVEFFSGTDSLGTATLSGGIATLPGVALADGVHSLTAQYQGAVVGSNNYEVSTSAAQSLTVNNVIVSTTTTLAVNGSGLQFQPVTLDVTVVPNNAVGSVQFFDGATAIGTQPVVNGTASLTIPTPALGAHSYSATFTPTNPADFGASSVAAPVDYTVAAGAGSTDTQNVNVEIPAGTLLLSVGDDGVVTLPAALAADGSSYEATGAMDPVTVADTRAGSFGWNATGQLGDFFQAGNPSIAAENLGWAPSVTSVSNGLMTVNPGAAVAAADAVAITAATGEGLATQRELADSPAGASVGTAVLDAVLTLDAPTTTLVGTHSAILTLTAI